MPRKLKIKLDMTVIRPVLLYGAECWTLRKKEEQILEKTEMRMLRWIKGITLIDKIKSFDIRRELGVNSIQEKVREMRLLVWTHAENGRKRWSESNCWYDSARKKTKREIHDGLCLKEYAGTADHPGGCPGQNILEIKNSGHWPHLVRKGEEEDTAE